MYIIIYILYFAPKTFKSRTRPYTLYTTIYIFAPYYFIYFEQYIVIIKLLKHIPAHIGHNHQIISTACSLYIQHTLTSIHTTQSIHYNVYSDTAFLLCLMA